jgi:ATP-dependent Zn protease
MYTTNIKYIYPTYKFKQDTHNTLNTQSATTASASAQTDSKTGSLQNISLTNSLVVAPPLRWEYDVYLDEVAQHHILHANITQDQKSAHLKFIDNSEREILLPSGNDNISYLLKNDVEVNITQSETLLTPVDIFLIFMQLLFLVRFITIDLSTKLKNKQENDKKRDLKSLQQSAKIITEACCDSMPVEHLDADTKVETNKSSDTEMEMMRNNVMVSMSGVIAEDMINGVFQSPTGPSNDISHILQIGYKIVANYQILDTPEQIHNFVCQTYRQCRIMLKKNIKHLKHIQYEIKNKKKPLNEEEILLLTQDILCDLDNFKY